MDGAPEILPKTWIPTHYKENKTAMRIPIRLYGGIAWEKREDDTALKTAHRVEPAITHFAISGAPITCEKYGHGHINCTYQVKTDDGHA